MPYSNLSIEQKTNAAASIMTQQELASANERRRAAQQRQVYPNAQFQPRQPSAAAAPGGVQSKSAPQPQEQRSAAEAPAQAPSKPSFSEGTYRFEKLPYQDIKDAISKEIDPSLYDIKVTISKSGSVYYEAVPKAGEWPLGELPYAGIKSSISKELGELVDSVRVTIGSGGAVSYSYSLKPGEYSWQSLPEAFRVQAAKSLPAGAVPVSVSVGGSGEVYVNYRGAGASAPSSKPGISLESMYSKMISKTGSAIEKPSYGEFVEELSSEGISPKLVGLDGKLGYASDAVSKVKLSDSGKLELVMDNSKIQSKLDSLVSADIGSLRAEYVSSGAGGRDAGLVSSAAGMQRVMDSGAKLATREEMISGIMGKYGVAVEFKAKEQPAQVSSSDIINADYGKSGIPVVGGLIDAWSGATKGVPSVSLGIADYGKSVASMLPDYRWKGFSYADTGIVDSRSYGEPIEPSGKGPGEISLRGTAMGPFSFAAGVVGAFESIVNPRVPSLWSYLDSGSLQQRYIEEDPGYKIGSAVGEALSWAVGGRIAGLAARAVAPAVYRAAEAAKPIASRVSGALELGSKAFEASDDYARLLSLSPLKAKASAAVRPVLENAAAISRDLRLPQAYQKLSSAASSAKSKIASEFAFAAAKEGYEPVFRISAKPGSYSGALKSFYEHTADRELLGMAKKIAGDAYRIRLSPVQVQHGTVTAKSYAASGGRAAKAAYRLREAYWSVSSKASEKAKQAFGGSRAAASRPSPRAQDAGFLFREEEYNARFEEYFRNLEQALMEESRSALKVSSEYQKPARAGGSGAARIFGYDAELDAKPFMASRLDGIGERIYSAADKHVYSRLRGPASEFGSRSKYDFFADNPYAKAKLAEFYSGRKPEFLFRDYYDEPFSRLFASAERDAAAFRSIARDTRPAYVRAKESLKSAASSASDSLRSAAASRFRHSAPAQKASATPKAKMYGYEADFSGLGRVSPGVPKSAYEDPFAMLARRARFELSLSEYKAASLARKLKSQKSAASKPGSYYEFGESDLSRLAGRAQREAKPTLLAENQGKAGQSSMLLLEPAEAAKSRSKAAYAWQAAAAYDVAEAASWQQAQAVSGSEFPPASFNQKAELIVESVLPKKISERDSVVALYNKHAYWQPGANSFPTVQPVLSDSVRLDMPAGATQNDFLQQITVPLQEQEAYVKPHFAFAEISQGRAVIPRQPRQRAKPDYYLPRIGSAAAKQHKPEHAFSYEERVNDMLAAPFSGFRQNSQLSPGIRLQGLTAAFPKAGLKRDKLW